MDKNIEGKIIKGIKESFVGMVNVYDASKILNVNPKTVHIYLLEMELKGLLERKEIPKGKKATFRWWKIKEK